MGRYMTPEEVAALLQVPLGYPYRHASQLGGVKVGKYLRFPESAVLRRLERSR
jgi:excisionase family DNA binding protein